LTKYNIFNIILIIQANQVVAPRIVFASSVK